MSPSAAWPLDLAEVWARRSEDTAWAERAATRFRDLLLVRLGGLVLVIACDSNAGIGNQPADIIRQSSRLTGFGAAKVPLMEVLAAGAVPMVVVNNLACALAGPGAEILDGIRDCLTMSGHRAVITGSDETNVPTIQSGVGVTVLGLAGKDDLLLGRSRTGDAVVVVGRPMDGLIVPYAETDPDVVTPREVVALVGSGLVHEVLPVGSKGIAYEASELARTAGAGFRACPSDVDMAISAGSSTCVVVTCGPGDVAALPSVVPQPVTVVGELVAADGR